MPVATINLKPAPKVLRQFGYAALVGFGLLAAMALLELGLFAGGLGNWRTGVAACLGALGVVSGAFSLTCPRANLPLFVVLSVIAFPIGFVLSYVILGLLFYGVITPAGLVLRLLGKDPMARRRDRSVQTYWIDTQDEKPDSTYLRQY